jgi:addiction module HigA family antidote
VTRKVVKEKHPGDRIRELLREHKLSQEVFADWIGVSRLTINQIINHHRGVTPEVALRIAAATNTSPTSWLDLQQQVDLRDARERLSEQISMIQPLIKSRRPRP